VYRSGPDFELGYSWEISFRGEQGDLDDLTYDASTLSGVGTLISVSEVRKGTAKEVQTLSTSVSGGTTAVPSSMQFKIEYGGLETGPIFLNPDGGKCAPTLREEQKLLLER